MSRTRKIVIVTLTGFGLTLGGTAAVVATGAPAHAAVTHVVPQTHFYV